MTHSTQNEDGALAGLELRMRELLGALDGAQLNTEVLERAWSACASHADEIEALARSVRSASPSRREALRAPLTRLVQLNAIARSAAEIERDRTSAEIERIDSARERLRELGAPDERGESCDIAG